MPKLAPPRTERITLYFREGSSDKVYTAAIEPQGDDYVVNFAFGRRGAALQVGTKTHSPVSFEQAKTIYDRLVREKTAKGYTAGTDGTPFTGTEKAGRVTCVLPQLLNPIEIEEVERLVADDDWWAQEKFDGRRTMIRRDDKDVIGINRTGLTVALPAPVAAAVIGLPTDRCLLDGELVGDIYHCFDLLNHGDEDVRDEPYARRYDAALNLIDSVPQDALRYAETAVTAGRKRKLIDRLRRENAEGVVFKNRLAPYTHGRPHVGGPQLKLKFWATASCIVAGTNGGKRSVRLDLYDRGDRVGVGNATIPVSDPMPPTGSVVEVRYLYAHPGGSLFQPVFIHRRDDVVPVECGISQLKFKRAGFHAPRPRHPQPNPGASHGLQGDRSLPSVHSSVHPTERRSSMSNRRPRIDFKKLTQQVCQLPPETILKATARCDGHGILKPEALTDAGFPAEVVAYLTTTHRSDGSPKGTIFVDGEPVKELTGVYGLDALRFIADALDLKYQPAMGRGFEAQNIQRALVQRFPQTSPPASE